MEKIFLILLSSLLLGASAGAKSAEDKEPRMTAEERTKTIKMLLDSQQEYLDALSNLTEAQWRFKPSPFQWSLGEVAEHILLTEIALFSSVEKALAQKPNPDWESKTAGKAEFIEKVVPSRSRRAQAPIEVRPSGKLSREEVVRRYKEARARVLEFTRTTDLPLKAHTLDHPFPVFNTLNAYDWLIYIPLHNIRHNQQIAEVKASERYPK
jgi:hypothetical protein